MLNAKSLSAKSLSAKSLIAKSLIAAVVVAGSLGLASTASHAAFIVSGSVGGAPVGASNYVNFDALALGNGGGTAGGITVGFTGGGAAVQGSVSGQYAAPFLSGGNGALFGTPNGVDATTYLTTGGTPGTGVSMQLPGLMQYLGILWGSVDSYNFLDFYSGATLIGTVSGSDVTGSPNGDQGVNGTLYVNISSTTAFDRVVARSNGFAFEFDNIAYFTGPSPSEDPVPVPATIALLGAAVAGLGLARRDRA